MKKVYAVRKGRKTGLFNTWAECQAQVQGFSGAEFKSFSNIEDAYQFLNAEVPSVQGETTGEQEIGPYEAHAYIDGSFDAEKSIYGAGVVFLSNSGKETICRSGQDSELASMRNVAGEIMAAEIAMHTAVDRGLKKLVIYYDYAGIEKWCTGEWQAKTEGTKKYKQFYDQMAQKIEIVFNKVKAHSGVKYNEEADMLAKQAVKQELAENK